MTADFRAICLELLDCLQKADWPPRYKAVFQQWVDIASVALLAPVPEPPSDADLMEVFWQHHNGMEEIWADDWPTAARAVLSRWGNHPAIPDGSTQPSDGPAVPNGREPASVTSQPSDNELFDLALKTHLVGFIAVAAALHPEKADPKDICGPANSAAIAYGRAVLEKWGGRGCDTDCAATGFTPLSSTEDAA